MECTRLLYRCLASLVLIIAWPSNPIIIYIYLIYVHPTSTKWVCHVCPCPYLKKKGKKKKRDTNHFCSRFYRPKCRPARADHTPGDARCSRRWCGKCLLLRGPGPVRVRGSPEAKLPLMGGLDWWSGFDRRLRGWWFGFFCGLLVGGISCGVNMLTLTLWQPCRFLRDSGQFWGGSAALGGLFGHLSIPENTSTV